MTTTITDGRATGTSRRRFLAIAGAVAGAALLPRNSRAAAVHDWRGVALGASASIRLLHPDPVEARRIIALAVAEIERLEAIFSLYRADSALVRLNREGRLEAAPLELVELLARAAGVSRASGGAFDVTVQPLWCRYRDHAAARRAGPPPLDDLLALVDWRAVELDRARVGFARAGMAITLNGIAQGFVTDRVAELLRRNGVEDVLLDLGEIRGLGLRPDGRPWQVGIADPAHPERWLARLGCTERAVASSGGYGTGFGGGFSHLIDPRSGRTAPALRGVTVLADEATLADAWSTAFALMAPEEVCRVAREVGGLEVHLAEHDGIRRLV